MNFTIVPRLGNKTASWKYIEDVMMDKVEEFYVEPFLGSGFVFYRMKQLFPDMYCMVGDIDNELGNFWWQSLTNTDAISSYITTAPSSEAMFNWFKDKELNDLERAVRFYYLSKLSGQDGVSFLKHGGRKLIQSNIFIDDFKEIMNILKYRCAFFQEDYGKIIERADKNWKKYLLYVDPPYFGIDTYNREFDHERLYNTIKDKNFVLSYNDCDWIRKKYKGFNILSYKVRKRKEVLIYV